MWEGVGDRTELQHIDPHSIGHNHVSFPFSWAVQPGAWGPSLPGCWFSLSHLISNLLNFLCTELFNISTPTFFLWASQIALIQPVHGQGYILIFLDRMHLLFTQVHFLFWQPGRVGGQYTTIVNILINLTKYWEIMTWTIEHKILCAKTLWNKVLQDCLSKVMMEDWFQHICKYESHFQVGQELWSWWHFWKL